MIFGASKLGVINNVHLIKMVRKIQKGKKVIIKILLVTLQYVAWHLLCCFLQGSPGPYQGCWDQPPSSINTVIILYPIYCRENCCKKSLGWLQEIFFIVLSQCFTPSLRQNADRYLILTNSIKGSLTSRTVSHTDAYRTRPWWRQKKYTHLLVQQVA